MRVKGAQFRGRRRIPRTTMTTIVSMEEMDRYRYPPSAGVDPSGPSDGRVRSEED